MAILTIITDAYGQCEECHERSEVILHHVDTNLTESRCYSCLTAIVLAAYQAMQASVEVSQELLEGDSGNGNNARNGVRGKGGRRKPRRAMDGGADGRVVVGTEGRPDLATTSEGADGAPAPERLPTGDGVGSLERS